MRKSRRSRIASINVIPYLDVMLVLLVIFMATAPLLTLGMVDVPEVKEPGETSGEIPDIARGVSALRVEYLLNNSVVVIDEYNKSVNFPDVDAAMGHIETECLLKPDRWVAVAGDKKQFYGEVMDLRFRIRVAGCRKIGFYVQPTK